MLFRFQLATRTGPGALRGDDHRSLALEEFGYRWLRVGGLGYALRRLPGRPQAQSPA
ncbi:MAG: hypothetical protein ACREXP_16240 [Steroidobacteraceae bacterium]